MPQDGGASLTLNWWSRNDIPVPNNQLKNVTTKSAFPACLITFPFNVEGKTAPFFLAAEEYVAAALPADNYLFAWILPPTVVMGRNQVADAEVDLEFCQREGIDVVRRKSGGGCIYADEGNIMFSLITPCLLYTSDAADE